MCKVAPFLSVRKISSNEATYESHYVKPTDESKLEKPIDEVGTVSIRYKAPDGDTSTEEEYAVRLTTGSASDDFNFASAVAEASMVITGSDHMGDSDIKNAAERAKDSAAGDEAREQFAELIGKF